MIGRFVLRQPDGIRTQKFGENATDTYKKQGLISHTGEDYSNGWKSPIKASITGEVYSTVNVDNPSYIRYRAIFQIIDTPDFSYEIAYGHIHDCFVKKGDIVKVGQVIATEGNWGDVYVNGKKPTTAERKFGAGSHLHFQVRKCIRVNEIKKGKKYLRDNNGYLIRNGFYYEIVDYDNGVNGCVNPALFYELDDSVVFKILKLLGLIK